MHKIPLGSPTSYVTATRCLINSWRVEPKRGKSKLESYIIIPPKSVK